MTALSVAVVSIVPTSRRRFFWAAWWTGAPTHTPFRKPDASSGGAGSHEEALAAAERAAQRTLQVVDSRWAQAWSRVIRELPPWTSRQSAQPRPRQTTSTPRAAPPSLWTTLGVTRHATAEELKAAYHKRALETHPDRGGDAEQFRALKAAYDKARGKRR
jgi:hypothetical protein